MQYPIKFPKHFMDAMLQHFLEADVPIGGKFDDPGRGSLSEFIQQKLKTKMNPAVYLAALLIEEGYADAIRRGYIRFRSKSSRHTSASKAPLITLPRKPRQVIGLPPEPRELH